MKKKLLIGLMVLAAGFTLLAGCSLKEGAGDGAAQEDAQPQEAEEALPEQPAQEAGETENENGEAEKDEEAAVYAEKEGPETMTVGEPYEVKTDAGNYSFTIKAVKHTDWMDDGEKEVIILCCEVANQDYEPEDGSILMLAGNSFHLYDGEAQLEEWDMTMSEGGFPDFVEAGETKSQEIPYIAAKGISQVKVVFADKEVEIAEVLCEVE